MSNSRADETFVYLSRMKLPLNTFLFIDPVTDIIGRFLSWLESRIFTFGNVSRDTSLIIWQSGLIFSHCILVWLEKSILYALVICCIGIRDIKGWHKNLTVGLDIFIALLRNFSSCCALRRSGFWLLHLQLSLKSLIAF